MTKRSKDYELDTLIGLDGEIYRMEDGYWVKFNAKLTTGDEHCPHGIRYSLTLHDKSNQRIIGFDNAHRVKPGRKRFTGRKRTWDHKHEREKITPYEFESPRQLLEDFWKEVDRIQMKRKEP